MYVEDEKSARTFHNDRNRTGNVFPLFIKKEKHRTLREGALFITTSVDFLEKRLPENDEVRNDKSRSRGRLVLAAIVVLKTEKTRWETSETKSERTLI